jgi:hypothetical protein
MPPPRPPSPRGSALLLAMVLLGVLTVIGAAAVMLASQERSNAAAKNRIDALVACANAAQAKIWAEAAQSGIGYLNSGWQVTPMNLPDGTKVIAPAHFGQTTGTPPTVTQVTFRTELKASTEGNTGLGDCTNRMACGVGQGGPGRTYALTALCRDAQGREYEVELAVKFAL